MAFADLVSNQEIAVDQARSTRLQAALALDVARIGLQSYREGQQVQLESSYLGQIALAKSDLSRQEDRVEWAGRMVKKGYVSLAQLASERLSLEKLKTNMKRNELALANFRKFTAPKQDLDASKPGHWCRGDAWFSGYPAQSRSRAAEPLQDPA